MIKSKEIPNDPTKNRHNWMKITLEWIYDIMSKGQNEYILSYCKTFNLQIIVYIEYKTWTIFSSNNV